MILDEGVSPNRDWAVEPVSLIGHSFIRRILPRFDAVGIYWIRPGREPEKDWTRRMRLRAKKLSLRTPPCAASHATWTRPGYRRFSGARRAKAGRTAPSAAARRLIQMGDWRVSNTTPWNRRQGRVSASRTGQRKTTDAIQIQE